MEQIIAAIALICGPEVCENKVVGTRFESIGACERFLSEHRLWQAQDGNMVVLDDCIITTEQRIAEFK